MKPIKIDSYKMFPKIGQELTLFWKENDPVTKKKVSKYRPGYILEKIFYNRKSDGSIELLAAIQSPNSGYLVITTYYWLCKDFIWLGDNFEPKYYEAK